MIWSDFVDAVDSHLAVEANRRGLEAYRSRYIRNAVLDLQRYIRGYRGPFKTTFTSADVTATGTAQLVELPSGAIPKELWIYQIDVVNEDHTTQCCRNKLDFYPWAQRQDLICGALSFNTYWACCGSTGNCPPTPLTEAELANWQSKAYVYTMGPMARNLLVFPQITASTRLELFYDSFLYTITDGDTVPFPEEASEAVAEYVLWKICTSIDKDPTLAKMHYDAYRSKRLELFRDFNEKADIDAKGEAYGATTVAP